MPTESDRFPPRHLKQDQCDPAILLTIQTIDFEMMDSDTGAEQVTVIHFNEDVPSMVCNRTNYRTISAGLGEDDAEWIGHQIVAYREPNVRNPRGELTGGIRVRMPKAAPTVAPLPEPEPVPF